MPVGTAVFWFQGGLCQCPRCVFARKYYERDVSYDVECPSCMIEYFCRILPARTSCYRSHQKQCPGDDSGAIFFGALRSRRTYLDRNICRVVWMCPLNVFQLLSTATFKTIRPLTVTFREIIYTDQVIFGRIQIDFLFWLERHGERTDGSMNDTTDV